MTAHMHADENESVAWRLQRAWDRQAFSCRSIFIAAAACRFWHVTGLVWGMTGWHSASQLQSRVTHNRRCSSGRNRNQDNSSRLFQAKVSVFNSRQGSCTRAASLQVRIHALRPTTTGMGIISHQNNSRPTGFPNQKPIHQHRHLSRLYTFHAFSFAGLQFHENAQ